MQFIAIDVETANPDMGSICQIGLAEFIDGEIVNEWVALVDPEDYFDEVNISIHGIGPQTIKGCPNILDLADRLRSALDGKVAVCHTHFDRIALGRAFGKYNLRPIATTWLDSARVVRRTWKDLAWRDYCLANVCRKIGYDFQHHDALEDAKAAGFVLLAALRESQKDIDYWLRRVNQPIDPKSSSSGLAIQRDGNPEGDFYGEILVFTGALELPRSEAADLAASIGYQVASGVTKKTTLLVVGDQDIKKLAGHEKSSKQRKAEQLVAEGHQLRIIRESDFKSIAMVARNELV